MSFEVYDVGSIIRGVDQNDPKLTSSTVVMREGRPASQEPFCRCFASKSGIIEGFILTMNLSRGLIKVNFNYTLVNWTVI